MNFLDKALAVTLLALPFAGLAQTPPIKPGQWDVAVTISAMDMPNPPPGFSAAVGTTTHSQICVTPAVAARGAADAIKPPGECNFANSMVDGSSFSFDMACQQAASKMTVVGNGSSTPDSFTVNGRASMSGDIVMTMTSTTVGKRVGECKK